MRFDYHMHTPLCQHATGEPREYVLAAQQVGISEIGFSDHNPMPTQYDDWRMEPRALETYIGLVHQAQTEFPSFPIRLGLECDFIRGYEDHIRTLAQRADWDYFIGSVHYITPDWDVDNPKHLKRWKDHPVEEIWSIYFSNYARMAASGLFDFLAHPDLVKKFGIRPPGDLRRFYTEALDAIADSGVAMEVSTAGLRKEVGEIYPSREFLEMAFARKIPILINSDAHQPSEVGYAFDDALRLVKEIGYSKLTRFEKRKAIETPI